MEVPLPPPEKLIFVHRQPNGVAYVIINRPKSLNSLTRSMMGDLAKAIKSLDSDNSVRVIILSGSGRAFCSGVDLTTAEDVFKGDVKDVETDPVAQMERCKKPIIGAINGFAVTAGFEIALACDLLVASEEAKFMDTHARFGIFPSWGLSQKLSRIIGPSRAREVSLTAMAVTAEQAERWGLVNHVVEGSELLKKARQIAEAIIKNNEDLVLRKDEMHFVDGTLPSSMTEERKNKAFWLWMVSLETSKIGPPSDLNSHFYLYQLQERAHEYYAGMTKEQFKKMQEFIAGRSSKKTPSKL
ncbi:UNVERIFIED_CONTAM: putative enoyl-CoA hydratase 1, peroxisomal [Sesamum radiatum]|uniref:Enoyl-CoA hydratase 1, peroxisomal n=1 Tax=Sesamum radiatum TaxID=300843 RepID=A0AAW2S8S2_SESRA